MANRVADTIGSKGLVTTDHKDASLAGLRIMKRGGNAADAAVASAAALTVLDPFMAGLGGYGYLMYYDASTDKTFALDFIGTAPRLADSKLYTQEKPWEDYKPSAEGILSILVPGAVAGWNALLEKFGNLKLRTVLQPAIELAKGYTVTPTIYEAYENRLRPAAIQSPDTQRVFYPSGHFPRPGSTFVQKNLAKTLAHLAEKGADDFYSGSLAKRMAKYTEERGGILRLEDLERYAARWVEPLQGAFGDWRIFSQPPGASGVTIIEWLNILKNVSLPRKWNSAEFIHLFVEAGKLALRDEDLWNTGKDYVHVPVEKLNSDSYAKEQAEKIERTKPNFYELATLPQSYGQNTVQHCTADGDGNMVSITQTQMYGFDRLGILGDLGFNLNGGMCYFNLDDRHIERIEPGQRPRYVMSPTFAFKEDTAVAIGSAGGWTIPQTITEVLLKIMQFGLGAQEAVSSPRFLLRYRYNSIPYAPGTVVDLEHGIPAAVAKELSGFGHTVRTPKSELSRPGRTISFGSLHAIVRNKRKIAAGTEPRRQGYVAAW